MTFKAKVSGTFATKPTKVRVGGTFVSKTTRVRVGGVFVPGIGGLDADTQAWIDDIELEGVTVSSGQKTAMNDCVVGLKGLSPSYWDSIYSMGLLMFGTNAANSVRAKIGGNITYPSGTATSDSTKLTFSSNGYADLGFAASDTGQTASSNGLMTAMPTFASGTGADMGCNIPENFGLFINYSGSNFAYLGSASSGSISGGSGTTVGLYAANRVSGDGQIYRQHSGGQTQLALSSTLSGGGVPTSNILLAAFNSFGSASLFSNRSYQFWLVQNEGVAQATLEDAMVIIYAMIQAFEALAESEAWIAQVEAQGWTRDGVRDVAMQFLVTNTKAVNAWDSIYSMGGLWFGSANPNRVRAKIGGLITFPAGTVTQNATNVAFSSGGYANLGFSSAAAGHTTTASGFLIAATAVGTGGDLMGAFNGTFEQAMASNRSGAMFYYHGPYANSTSTNDPGVYFGILNAIGTSIIFGDGGGTSTKNTASGTGNSAASIDIFLSCQNSSGSPSHLSSNSIAFWSVLNGTAMSNTIAEDFSDVIVTALEMIGSL